MTTVRGCEMPDTLLYDIEANVWCRLEDSGLLTLGMTAYACSLSGDIVACMPRKPGKEVQQGKSCATVESGKWVGPVKAPVSGEIIEVNQHTVDDPASINADPYGTGWLIRMRPLDWQAESVHLLSGQPARDAYAAKMDEEGFGGC